MKRIIYGTVLIIILIEMAFASGYGNDSPGRISDIAPIDNVSPASNAASKSIYAIEIVKIVPSDNDEYLVLQNKGMEDSVLERWFISVDEKILLSLPRIYLGPNSEVELHIGNGNNSTATKIYIGYPSPILDDAGNVSLIDESGRTMVEKKYP
ncbi:hypothetical protein [Methanothrix sp.]|uniref:hypothetical protein n=1 Tax=Methanothrix sp. TaxID=90426 RepID=UPI003298BAB1